MEYKVHSYITTNGTSSSAAAQTEYGMKQVGHVCLADLNAKLLPVSIKAATWSEAKTKFEAVVEGVWKTSFGELAGVAGTDSEVKDKDGKWEPKNLDHWYAHPLVQTEKSANLAYSIDGSDAEDFHVINNYIDKSGA